MTTGNFILFLLCTYSMGFIAAIPIGATQLELVRRTIHGYFRSALFLVLGSVSSDTGYGFIAIFGLSHFLLRNDVIAVFWLFNAIILIFIGLWVILHDNKTVQIDTSHKPLMQKYSFSLITGFSLAVTNPLMISWWLLGTEFLKSLGIIEVYTEIDYIIFILTGALGIASYLSLLAYITYKAKKFMTEQTLKRISFIFAIILLGLAVYFLVKSIHSFLK